MVQHAKELYFCVCGAEAMKQVILGKDKLAAGYNCQVCGKPMHFDEAYACDENGRITE